jgi:uncharacterized membrane protein YGL010W
VVRGGDAELSRNSLSVRVKGVSRIAFMGLPCPMKRTGIFGLVVLLAEVISHQLPRLSIFSVFGAQLIADGEPLPHVAWILQFVDHCDGEIRNRDLALTVGVDD